jgi:hypothetical protein
MSAFIVYQPRLDGTCLRMPGDVEPEQRDPHCAGIARLPDSGAEDRP